MVGGLWQEGAPQLHLHVCIPILIQQMMAWPSSHPSPLPPLLPLRVQALPSPGSSSLSYLAQPQMVAAAAASAQLLSLLYTALVLFVPSAAVAKPSLSSYEVQQYVVSVGCGGCRSYRMAAPIAEWKCGTPA